MNQLNYIMIKEFYEHNNEVQNKKTHELDNRKKKIVLIQKKIWGDK